MYYGELYRMSLDGPLLLCISEENIPKIFYEVHGGWYGRHLRGRELTWWETTKGKKRSRVRSGSGDYFSKWVEAAPLKKIIGDKIIHFLWKHIVTWFGIPKS
ncbi:hypothetical protein LIER_11348 [Lithospermum erythrorhizon]|uniref:Uncharacterized protein n=1 Tax=Lithospermum erythrorhizon TaxID=34254 RepID=A0AAV3PPM4_LITER